MTSISHLMNTTVAVWRAVEGSDGRGGRPRTWSQVETLPARIPQPDARGEEVGEQSGADVATRVYFDDPQVDVRRGDELRQPGRTLRVVDVVVPSVPIYARADCAARQPDSQGGA